ncbi:uncharacterized protein LOC130722250 [Lotus japonicus]|uniref:uncharacterized protein LOC130722250 n=1 Tax=Lotus japonicus TaxID=34305 RepID=UPI0025908B8F|nr:uncharacterized protein LOC130722250 [Lotus japonicus]
MGDESPKNKVKFLCSYGGKVLPRPSDGVLKYVGGETRVICVPRDITFSEMMKKVNGMVDGEVVLKYQVIPEDLDALVSVRTEEDIKHMIEEQDRHESSGGPLLRAFLFPSKPVTQQLQIQVPPPPSCEPYFIEQRYIDAINGIIRTSPRSCKVTPAACSACSSPKSTSPDAHTVESPPPSFLSSVARVSNSMHKVRSSPSLTNLSQHDHSTSHYNHHHHHPVAVAYPSSCKNLQEAHLGMGRPPQMMAEMNTKGPTGLSYYYPATRTHNKGGYMYQDESAPPNGHYMFERVHSVPRSRSPLKSIWD